MNRTRILLGSLLTLVVACGGGGNGTPDAPAPTPDSPPPTPDAPSTAVPRAEPTACRFDVDPSLGSEGTDYECGDLIVWENRTAQSRTIKVHYIRFRSGSASHDATIYLDGGPGGDGQGILSFASFIGPAFLDAMLVDGDFYVISQRGTARSLPFLNCQDPDCADFAHDADLTQYNTAANADDVEDLRTAMGITQWNLYGISYGSRLGLEVIRRHGDQLRSALIEGLVPPNLIWPAEMAASFYGAIQNLNQSCADAGACGTTFGDLEAKFLHGITVLDGDPVSIDVGGSPFPIDGQTYAYVLFNMMYSKSSFDWLPLVINDLEVRRTDRVDDFLAAWIGALIGAHGPTGAGGGGLSRGLFYGVVCGELFSPPTPNAFETATAGVPAVLRDIFASNYDSTAGICQTWPSSGLESELSQPVTSAVRTFVSNGRLDPITPVRFGTVANATLSNSVFVIHENSGHGATLQSPCGQQNLYQFIADPLTPHDTSCAASITNDYVIPATALVARPVPAAAIRAEAALVPAPPFMIDRLTSVAR